MHGSLSGQCDPTKFGSRSTQHVCALIEFLRNVVVCQTMPRRNNWNIIADERYDGNEPRGPIEDYHCITISQMFLVLTETRFFVNWFLPDAVARSVFEMALSTQSANKKDRYQRRKQIMSRDNDIATHRLPSQLSNSTCYFVLISHRHSRN